MTAELFLSQLSDQYAFPLEILWKSLVFTAVNHDFSSKGKKGGLVTKTFSYSRRSNLLFKTVMTYLKFCCALLCAFFFASKYNDYDMTVLLMASLPVTVSLIATTLENPKHAAIDFAETYAIAYLWHWTVQQRYSPELEQSNTILCLNMVAFILFSWPLVDGTITLKGVIYRVILFLLYPFAYSDSATSELYQQSSMKPQIDWMMYALQVAVMFLAISGLKGKVSMIMKQQWSFFRNLNYWGILGLAVFPLLATKDFPMTLDEVPAEWFGSSSWFTSAPEPTLTPFLFSCFHKCSK